jgi:hypothetical protein
MIGVILTILAFYLGFYFAAVYKQKTLQEQRKKLHENMAYFKGVPYPVCYITQANYYKYEDLLIPNVIYVLTDDETKQNWSLDK